MKNISRHGRKLIQQLNQLKKWGIQSIKILKIHSGESFYSPEFIFLWKNAKNEVPKWVIFWPKMAKKIN